MAHGVILVHGIGEQLPGETLAQVANPIADYLERAGGDKLTVVRKASIPGGAAPAEVTITLQGTTTGGTVVPRTRWIFKEVWWAQSLLPPPYRDMLRWAWEQYWRQIWSVFNGLRAAANDDGQIPALRPVFNILRNATYEGVKDDQVSLPRLLRIYDPLVIFFLEFLFLSGAPVVFGLIIIGWVISFLPDVLGLGILSEQLEKLLRNFLVLSIGDAKTYVDNGVWAANILREFEEAVLGMLKDPSMQDITVISHSWGTVIAYEGLSENGEVASFLSQNPQAQKKITLVTLGSALNRVKAMVEVSSSPHAKNRLNRHLIASIFWSNLYSRYDPVPAGKLDSSLKTQSGLAETNFKERRVVNLDDIVNDHGAYWSNTELVVPRLARAINGGSDYPFPEARLQPQMVQHRLIIVAKMATLRLLFSFATIANAAIAALSLSWRNALLSIPEQIPVLGEGLVNVHDWFRANRILNLNLEPFGSWMIASLLIALLALVVYKIIRYGVWKDI